MESQNSGMGSLLGANQLLRLLSSQSVSTYANQVIAFVIPWLVLTRTGSAVSAGTVAFAMGVAAFAGVMTGGLITDRIGGRKVSMIADLLSTVTALLLGIALFFDFFSLWLVIVSQIIGVFFDGPGQIAKNTMVPGAATAHDVPIVRAMGIQQTLQNVANFVGPLSAGLLVALLSESVTLMFASVLFAFCIFLVLRLPRQRIVHEHPMSVRQAYQDMREAVQFLINDPFLGPMQLFGPFFAFVVGPVSAIVFPAWFVFARQSAAQLGIFLGAQALGGMIGGFLFAALAPKVSQHKWLFGATGLYALALLVLYFLQPGSVVAMLVGFLAGVIFTGIMAIPYSSFYTRTPERLLGRVNSLGAGMGFIIIALASLFFGWLINATSARTRLLVCAIIMGLIALGVLLFPFMKHLDEKVGPEDVHEPTQSEA
ncbi:MAG TPA: MFS transporter [Anaerolineales bacterium]|nr:MFS transporter [Anaerolineales bacterium]